MTKPCIITIDGPAGVGKSSLAHKVAVHFSIAYLDTGAMFRSIAIQLKKHIDFKEKKININAAELQKLLATMHFSLERKQERNYLLCNGEEILEKDIRTEEAASCAAIIAQNKQIRDFLKQEQQKLANSCSLLAEGRDMGTEVFPHACAKFFLDAQAEVRALRRYKQLTEAGLHADLNELTKQIQDRDQQDRNRPIAPLKAAEDAIIIDTSELSIDEVYKQIITACENIFASSLANDACTEAKKITVT